MRHEIKSAAIVGKAARPEIQALGTKMQSWLQQRGVQALFCSIAASGEVLCPDIAEADIVVILGGDGTFIAVARQLPCVKPLLGVNFGRVGFLTDLRPDDWEKAFAHMLQQGVRLEWGLGLKWTVVRDGEEVASCVAVNDVVVTRGALARLVGLDISVDGTFVSSLRADGLILSTPTGSTGYTSSARGPLLHPTLNAYSLTPICAFMSNFLPLVLDGSMTIGVTVRESGPELFMTVDGQELFPLQQGDTLLVRGQEKSLCFARLGLEAEYFAKLRSVGLV